MGQEWAATTPFLYFTDHPEELGKLVTIGRRYEFRHFSAFADPDVRERSPDPQAEATFKASGLDWSEIERSPHAATHRLYQRLLALRRAEPAIRCGRFAAFALGDTTLMLRQDAETGPSLLVVIQMNGSAQVNLAGHEALAGLDPSLCQVLFTTEDQPFAPDAKPPAIELANTGPRISFLRPSAVLLSMWPMAPPQWPNSVRPSTEPRT
jgi:maltooligosyltrehalose trehalohydrolase